MADFLKKDAQTPLQECYLAAGAVCAVKTNFQPILEAARQSFLLLDGTEHAADFRLRLWVDPTARTGPPWPKPYFRGLDHLVFAGFDSQNSLAIDLRTRRAIGRFSPAMGEDRAYWKKAIFPNLLTVLGTPAGVVGLHCGCVVQDGEGLLLVGGSRSGKSTLALALAKRGFAFLSDDWTYFSRREECLLAWGLRIGLKLLPDATDYFPEFQGREVRTSLNGERGYEVDPGDELGLPVCRCCEPRRLVFLERQEIPAFRMIEISSAEAVARLTGDVLADAPESITVQLDIIKRVARSKCWLLRYGGAPQAVAQNLIEFCQST